ncbi:hypothetical protein BST81_16430 [Leptolyngbya sp. 'hensonii']|uniref:hypothetical protein n=1 Tax=Leptolyngbya sp. 'hensonii' TaxID=1922337 RepID=UPI0009647C68|nr:hypothetical protein [Leptolyngbya sp. 'hensonii']OLP17385.1 hypothetical protein BST81_16430 [Leptolyngbya sp. 'hensonii']
MSHDPMEQFPIILIPAALREVQVDVTLFPIPPGLRAPQPPRPPRPPGRRPRRWNQMRVIQASLTILSLGFLATALLMILYPPTSPTLLIFVPIPAVVLGFSLMLLQLQSFPRRLHRYRRRQRHYQQQRQLYDRALLVFAEQKHQYQLTLDSIKSAAPQYPHRQALLLQVLRQTVLPDRTKSAALRGRSEGEFGEYLRRYFPDKIYTGLALTIPGYSHPYTPDFAYVDRTISLCLDIEIDEPYRHGEADPLHYRGSEKDRQRNAFFLNRGWIVIRFSEEQAMRQANSCCKTIAATIAQILTDPSYLLPFSEVPDLQPVRCWTAEEGKQMARQNYRAQYGC